VATIVCRRLSEKISQNWNWALSPSNWEGMTFRRNSMHKGRSGSDETIHVFEEWGVVCSTRRVAGEDWNHKI
jgi:hypothetical protein